MADGGHVEEDSPAARAGLTLAVVKAALQKWQGHMRRAALLQSEAEYAAALALVPQLPSPAASQAKTLRGLADLYASQGRLDDAAAMLQRIAQGGGRLSARFWGDYATLLFKLGLQRVGAGRVALANDAFSQAAGLLQGPADLPEVWSVALDGYLETALWFERAGEAVPAGLYAERALGLAGRLPDWERAGNGLRRLVQAAQSKGGSARALHWLDRWQSLRAQGWPEALSHAVQAALALARAELALGRRGDAQAIFEAASSWVRQAGPESPALADLHLGWGLALGADAGAEHLRQAVQLRRRLLGVEHPRTKEAEQALGGFSAQSPPPAPEGGPARAWDGGAVFQAPPPDSSAELKRLHRRLVRLCHPDAAPDEAWRHGLMVRVNQAAELGDLYALRGLLREALSHLAQSHEGNS
jgi:hypothetical protein